MKTKITKRTFMKKINRNQKNNKNLSFPYQDFRTLATAPLDLKNRIQKRNPKIPFSLLFY